jgi:hypothetical protein
MAWEPMTISTHNIYSTYIYIYTVYIILCWYFEILGILGVLGILGIWDIFVVKIDEKGQTINKPSSIKAGPKQ